MDRVGGRLLTEIPCSPQIMANRVLPAGRCGARSTQPLEGLPGRLAPRIAGDHVAVFPPALVLHRHVGRSSRHHPPGHADAFAVSGPVRLNLGQGAGGGGSREL